MNGYNNLNNMKNLEKLSKKGNYFEEDNEDLEI